MTNTEFNNCVNNYTNNVYRFILKNIRVKEDAEDIIQTAFANLWK
jgi:RNA polymerase sigma-70 factor (ECF subfamily)